MTANNYRLHRGAAQPYSGAETAGRKQIPVVIERAGKKRFINLAPGQIGVMLEED